MLDNLRNALRELQGGGTVQIPIEADAQGYLDRECPSAKCLFFFKIREEHWTGLDEGAYVFCPFCRHTAPKKSWYSRAQAEAIQRSATAVLQGRLNDAARRDAKQLDRRSGAGGLMRLSMSVNGQETSVTVPVQTTGPLQLSTQCEGCGCDYAYIGAAYFCPRCGENSADHTFRQTLRSVRMSAALGETLRNSLEPDAAEVANSFLLEKGILDTVTSFQRLNEQLYDRCCGKTARRNAFQNLQAGSRLWEEELGTGYADLVSDEAISRLGLFFQQRHLLAHQQGIVDSDYVDKSGDSEYAIGQRLVVRQTSVVEFVDLVENLIEALLERIECHDATPL